MSNQSYAADLNAKTSLLPSRQTIRRAAFVLALTLGAACAADLGYDYLSNGR